MVWHGAGARTLAKPMMTQITDAHMRHQASKYIYNRIYLIYFMKSECLGILYLCCFHLTKLRNDKRCHSMPVPWIGFMCFLVCKENNTHLIIIWFSPELEDAISSPHDIDYLFIHLFRYSDVIWALRSCLRSPSIWLCQSLFGLTTTKSLSAPSLTHYEGNRPAHKKGQFNRTSFHDIMSLPSTARSIFRLTMQ